MPDGMSPGSESLRPLFQPRSVAVVGASRTPGKSGYVIVENLIRCGYQGRIFPINPAGGEVAGVAAYASVAAAPEPPECAMIVVPAPQVPAAARDCAAAGVKAVVLGAAGFAETNTADGRAWQAELAALAKSSGMRMLGPNTNGLYSAVDKFSLGYNTDHREPQLPGVISLLSHSGALFGGAVRSLAALGVGFSKFVPVGNEADINMMDMLEFLIEDATTRVIGLIVEGLSQGYRFRDLARRAQKAGKPIVALKVGRSEAGVGAALAHSSRLGGRARAYDALFDACGVAVVRSVEALAGGCAVLAGRTPRGRAVDRRMIGISTSGAGGGLVADFAAARDIPLAGSRVGEWEGSVAEALLRLDTKGWIRNPIDMGNFGGEYDDLDTLYRAMEQAGMNGPTGVYAHVIPRQAHNEKLADIIAARRDRTGAPVVVVAPGGLTPALEERYRGLGVPLFRDMGTAFDSLACHYQTLEDGDYPSAAPPARDPAIAAALDRAAGPFLSETASAELLRRVGVPMVASRLVADPAAAAAVGYPLVLKALAPGVAHKHDAGLVVLDIRDRAQLDAGWEALEAAVAVGGHDRARVDIIAQPMMSAEARLIAGVSREPGLGHFLVLGLGGIEAEALDLVTLYPIPMSRAALTRRISASPLGRLLARLRAPVDVLVNILTSLSGLVQVEGERIESIDVNPLLVTAEGYVAVDALVVKR